jgi:hypothetical protein
MKIKEIAPDQFLGLLKTDWLQIKKFKFYFFVKQETRKIE